MTPKWLQLIYQTQRVIWSHIGSFEVIKVLRQQNCPGLQHSLQRPILAGLYKRNSRLCVWNCAWPSSLVRQESAMSFMCPLLNRLKMMKKVNVSLNCAFSIKYKHKFVLGLKTYWKEIRFVKGLGISLSREWNEWGLNIQLTSVS